MIPTYEEAMRAWDLWREEIASGHKGTAPRDGFESYVFAWLGAIADKDVEIDRLKDELGHTRMCVNCGRYRSATEPKEALPECIDPSTGLSACTWDATPREAAEFWQDRYYEMTDLKERYEMLQRDNARLVGSLAEMDTLLTQRREERNVKAFAAQKWMEQANKNAKERNALREELIAERQKARLPFSVISQAKTLLYNPPSDKYEAMNAGFRLANAVLSAMDKEPRVYDPSFGDERLCICGHTYYRHFDTYEDMEPVGCKYCGCSRFDEANS